MSKDFAAEMQFEKIGYFLKGRDLCKKLPGIC